MTGKERFDFETAEKKGLRIGECHVLDLRRLQHPLPETKIAHAHVYV